MRTRVSHARLACSMQLRLHSEIPDGTKKNKEDCSSTDVHSKQYAFCLVSSLVQGNGCEWSLVGPGVSQGGHNVKRQVVLECLETRRGPLAVPFDSCRRLNGCSASETV